MSEFNQMVSAGFVGLGIGILLTISMRLYSILTELRYITSELREINGKNIFGSKSP